MAMTIEMKNDHKLNDPPQSTEELSWFTIIKRSCFSIRLIKLI